MSFTLAWHDGKWNKETQPNFNAAKAKFDSWKWAYACVIASNNKIYFAYAGAHEMHNQGCTQVGGGSVGVDASVAHHSGFRMAWHDGRYRRANYGSYAEAFKAFDSLHADKSAIARVVFHGNKVVMAYVGSELIHTHLCAHAGRDWYLTYHDGGFKSENFANFGAAMNKFNSFGWKIAACLADPEGRVYLSYAGAETLQQQLHGMHLQLADEKSAQPGKYRLVWHSGDYKCADYGTYAEAIGAFDKVHADKNAVARILLKGGKILAAYVGGDPIRTGLLTHAAK